VSRTMWLTSFDKVIWKVLRGFVEELNLFKPECEVDFWDARLGDVLHAGGPVHVLVVVLPSRLSRAVHVGETVCERGVPGPSGVRVGTGERVTVIDLIDVPLAVRLARDRWERLMGAYKVVDRTHYRTLDVPD